MAARRAPASRALSACLTAAAAIGLAPALPAQAPLSVEDVLREARAADARLPLPALELSIARSRQREALAAQWLKVAAEGEFVYAPHDGSGYDPTLTDLAVAKLQVVARQPIYAGGALKAGAERAGAAVAAAGAR